MTDSEFTLRGLDAFARLAGLAIVAPVAYGLYCLGSALIEVTLPVRPALGKAIAEMDAWIVAQRIRGGGR